MTMRRAKNSIRSPRSDEDLARMVVSVAKEPRLTVSFLIRENKIGDENPVTGGEY